MDDECCDPCDATLTNHNEQHPTGAEFTADSRHCRHTGRIEQAEDEQGICYARREDFRNRHSGKERTEGAYHNFLGQQTAH